MIGDGSEELARWAANVTPKAPKARLYPLTPEGDYQAWVDQILTRMARDRAEVSRTVRGPSDWTPRGEAA